MFPQHGVPPMAGHHATKITGSVDRFAGIGADNRPPCARTPMYRRLSMCELSAPGAHRLQTALSHRRLSLFWKRKPALGGAHRNRRQTRNRLPGDQRNQAFPREHHGRCVRSRYGYYFSAIVCNRMRNKSNKDGTRTVDRCYSNVFTCPEGESNSRHED